MTEPDEPPHSAWWARDELGLILLDARVGRTYDVGPILLGMGGDALFDCGIKEGSRLKVTARYANLIDVLVDDEHEETITLEYGVFLPLIETSAHR